MKQLTIGMTGITGFIGRAAARDLLARGHVVRGLVRPGRASAVADLEVEHVKGGMSDPAARAALLENVDVLVHNAFDWAAKVQDLRSHLQENLCAGIQLFQQAASQGCRVVFVSSVAVHQHMLDAWDGRIDHSHPMRPGGLYGALKAALESHLWGMHTQDGLPFNCLRPCAVYGVDPNHARSVGWPMVEKLLAGEAWGRRGGGKFVHVDDVAACMVAAAESTHSGGRIHHLTDCYARWSDWEAIAAEQLGLDPTVEHLDPPAPRNMFETESVTKDLHVNLNRGMDGIASHIAAMIELQRGTP